MQIPLLVKGAARGGSVDFQNDSAWLLTEPPLTPPLPRRGICVMHFLHFSVFYPEGGSSYMRIPMMVVGVVVAVGLLVGAMGLEAHHAFAAAFDENKPINLVGVVTRVEL